MKGMPLISRAEAMSSGASVAARFWNSASCFLAASFSFLDALLIEKPENLFDFFVALPKMLERHHGVGGDGFHPSLPRFFPTIRDSRYFNDISASGETFVLLPHEFPKMQAQGFAAHGFDAADAGGDGGFVEDFEVADLVGVADVGASAEFLGEVADGDDADGVAVFVAEELEDGVGSPLTWA